MDFTNIIVNGFAIRYKLGEGGMAEVWYAENQIGKKAAIKLLKKELCHNHSIRTRFENEAKTMVKLEHDNIRQVYDYAVLDNIPCIIMEYLEGEDLKTKIHNNVSFSEHTIQSFWNQCVDALRYTHSKGVVHRDIKPSNIFITQNNKVKILDFGIAKMIGDTSKTQTGSVLGTLMYMSPEQVKESKNIDYKTDLFSLAVSFAYILKGKNPYGSDSSSAFEIQGKIVNGSIDLSNIPDRWKDVISKYLYINPEYRAELEHFNSKMSYVSINKSSTSIPNQYQNSGKDSTLFIPKQENNAKSVSIADSKPKRNSGLKTGLLISIPILLVAGMVACYFIYWKPHITETVFTSEDIANNTHTSNKLSHLSAIASSELPGYDQYNYKAINVVDKDLETWWSPSDESTNEWLKISFNKIIASGVYIHAGSHFPDYPGYGDLYYQNCRVTKARLSFSDGSSEIIYIPENDRIELITFAPRETTYIKFTPLRWSRGATWQDICISHFMPYIAD